MNAREEWSGILACPGHDFQGHETTAIGAETVELRAALDAAQDEIERLLSEIAAVRIERDNRDAALTAVLKVHRQDPYDGAWCVCEELWPCSTTVAIAGALGGDA